MAGIDLDRAAPAFDQALDDGQAHATPLNLVARLEGLKDRKDAVVIGRVDAGSIIGHGEFDAGSLISRGDDDATGTRAVVVFDGVVDQVAEDRFEGDALRDEDGQGTTQVDLQAWGEGEQIQ